MVKSLKRQSKHSIHDKKEKILDAMRTIPDFYLELKWDFHTWS